MIRGSLSFVFLLLSMATLHAADKIVLRNLEILRECEVASFNEDGLTLVAERANGSRLVTWDEVESLTLDAQQAEANKLLTELGPSLYAIQRRLLTGDDESLLAPAEKMWPVFRERKGRSACLVALALMWSRLAQGPREGAVEPWLKAYELMRSRVLKMSEIPGKRKLILDGSTALNWELEPVWFDSVAAKKVLPALDAMIATMNEPVPEGAKLYLASLALAAGEHKIAEPLLDATYQQEKASALQKVLIVQQACLQKNAATEGDELRRSLPNMPADLQPLALYWLGQACLLDKSESKREEAFIHFLRIPAIYGRHSPDLAAAALFATHEHYREDRRLATRLRQELLEKYPTTFHGKKMMSGN